MTRIPTLQHCTADCQNIRDLVFEFSAIGGFWRSRRERLVHPQLNFKECRVHHQARHLRHHAINLCFQASEPVIPTEKRLTARTRDADARISFRVVESIAARHRRNNGSIQKRHRTNQCHRSAILGSWRMPTRGLHPWKMCPEESGTAELWH